MLAGLMKVFGKVCVRKPVWFMWVMLMYGQGRFLYKEMSLCIYSSVLCMYN